MQVRKLLAQARMLYDDPQLPFARAATQEGWRTGFASGAEWMRLVMTHIRGANIPVVQAPYNTLGLFKYGLASLCALGYMTLTIWADWWLLLPGFILVFYAIEAQMVFLFPLVIDGCPQPLAESLAWTRRGGGTLRVMSTVMPVAAVMLLGGFVGGGFIRSWSLGCLAIVLWYEDLRNVEYRLA
jgi:hypothetical protein